MTGRWISIAGFAIWLVASLSLRLPLEAMILLFAPLVLVPLALGLIDAPQSASAEHRLLAWAKWLQLPAAALLAASFSFDQGWPAAALTTLWLGVTILLALVGCLRLWRLGGRLDGEAGVTAALLFIVVGGGWGAISRAGLRPQEFSHAIVLLTGVHFHYAGFVLPLLAGLTVNELNTTNAAAIGWRDRVMLLGVIVGVPAVGVGISLSPHVEVVAAVVLAFACLLVAVRQVQSACCSGNPMRLTFSLVSSLALVSAMGLAGAYAVGEFTGRNWLAIPTMIRTHGAFNAFGFAACGLIASMCGNRDSKLSNDRPARAGTE